MSRIFISHSSRNNKVAVEVRDWLAFNGWDDIFLDLDPKRGIAAGERWKAALQRAAHRCEVVLALVSSSWLASAWCKAETDAARLMGKKVLICLVEAVHADIPADLSDEQWIDLKGDPAGYTRLKDALKRAGLDASTFPFQAGRRPYPGLDAFQEDDAAVYFGREAQIVRGLDKLRSMSRNNVEKMLVILGASGAGKSSFLRAGLLPRLKRDDRTWLIVPTVRPERAALSGPFGLAQAIRQIIETPPFSQARKMARLPRSRDEIQSLIESEGLARVFRLLRTVAQASDDREGRPPLTIVVPVDQAEELFIDEDLGEATSFMKVLTVALQSDPSAIGLITIRSDSFPRFQMSLTFAELPRETFPLDAMLAGSYRAAIEGPAALVEPVPLRIDPQLTELLLKDLSGQDALPLLAFTLHTLFEEYSSLGQLTLSNYLRLGGVKGVIDKTVQKTKNHAISRGLISKDERAQRDVFRRMFVPHLVRVNDAGQFVRRVADIEEIFPNLRELVQVFSEYRLLSLDFRVRRGSEGVAVEVAHGALLREWKQLNDILIQEYMFKRARVTVRL